VGDIKIYPDETERLGLEARKLRVDLAIARHAYFLHMRKHVDDALRRIETATKNAVELPGYITKAHVEKLERLRAEMEIQIVEDCEVVLRNAKKERS